MNHLTLTREQVRDVDRRAIAEFGMTGLVLMENAGRGCVDVLEKLGIAGEVVICCGKGNNGGDGLVIARHLDLRGHSVRVLLCCEPSEITGDAAANFQILAKSDVAIQIVRRDKLSELQKDLLAADWIVDALLGTGTVGAPRPPLDFVIEQMNRTAARKLAVDLPSGLDCDSGQPAATTFRADHTCTFVAAKVGFAAPKAQSVLGQVHVLDIGAPRKLIESLG